MYKKKLTTNEAFALAVKNHKKNNLETSRKLCAEILKGNPNHIGSLIVLAAISIQKNEVTNAFFYYKKVISIDPNHKIAINNLAILFRDTDIRYLTQININIIKELLIFLLKKKEIDHKDIFPISNFLLFNEKQHNKNEIENVLNSNLSVLKNEIIQNLLKNELFILILQKCLTADYFLEKVLTKLRFEILSTFISSKENISEEMFTFVVSLAEQCFFNEYIYVQEEKESSHVNEIIKSIDKNKKINELEITILACYVPLHSIKSLADKLLNYKSNNILFNDLIKFQIKEPLKEKKIINTIQSLVKISNIISKKVNKQYEEYPYPRWRCTYSNPPVKIEDIVNSLIKPNKIKLENKFMNPNVLVAGCGTGKQTILAAKSYLNAKVVGVDLSLSSLSYAKRKSEELGITNIEFLCGDILELKSLKKKFDIIECVGVLHHMEKPLEGLKILTNLLEDHGLIRLGLYSEIARQDIINVRKFIKENEFKNTSADIKNFRKILANEKNNKLFKKIFYRTDFYSTSSAKDLIFHTNEHRFNLEEISKMLKNLNLEFLGFMDTLKKIEYAKLFPEDKNNVSLNNWHKFELNNVDTFHGMYNFWVRKIQ